MGVFTVTAEIGDPAGQRYEPIELTVDTGSTYTTLPTRFLRGHGVVPTRKQRFVLADGRTVESDVGQTWLRLQGQTQMTIVAFTEENTPPLLGAVTLEEFGLGVDPVAGKLIPAVGYRLTRIELHD
jgi:predicted aspartyl protease